MTDHRSAARPGRRSTDRFAPTHSPVAFFLALVGIVQCMISFSVLGGLHELQAEQQTLQKDLSRTKEVVIDGTKRFEKLHNGSPKKEQKDKPRANAARLH